MGLRSLLTVFVVQALLWHGLRAKSIHKGRDSSITVDNTSNKKDVVIYSASSPTEVKVYHPPLLSAPPGAIAPQIAPQNTYQPPLLLAHSDNKPLISSSQTQSVRYQAPGSNAQLQGIPIPQAYSPPAVPSSQGYSAPLLASAQTGNLNTLSLQQRPRQGFSYSGDPAVANQFNEQPAAQAESQPAPSAVSSTGDAKNDEYVVYYYYYYDNDTASNSSSNFDDIPSLESYDTDKSAKEPEKSASARTLAADVNSLSINGQEKKRLQEVNALSQPRSASSGNSNQPPFIRSDKPSDPQDELAVQPLKPVSNVFRYGSNEVPRFPILPNFVVSEAPPPTKPDSILTSNAIPEVSPTTQTPGSVSGPVPGVPSFPSPDQDIDEANNVVEQPSNSKIEEEKTVEQTTTTTTTEPPTTTEIPTTTTERARRRPGTGNRRRFNPSPSFSSNRRQTPTRSSSTTSSTTTTSTPGISSTRGSFRGSSRARQRPTISSNRARNSFSRNTPASSDNEEAKSTTSSSVATSSTTAKPRFGGSPSSSRRFSSTRTRSPSSGTTRSTTTTTTSPRPRPAPRPRPNIISRSRPPRPGLFRSRTPSEPEEPEPTTPAPESVTEEESSPSLPNESVSAEENETVDDSDEEDETSDIETEAPTTTEKSRFSALFRPRNRSTLNRPRPPIGRRSR